MRISEISLKKGDDMRSPSCLRIREVPTNLSRASKRSLVTASLSVVLLALCMPVFGQSDAIVVTVSRNVDLSPDAIYFSLAVVTDPDITVDQVLQASQTLGLTAQNLTSVNLQQYGPSAGQARLAYAFDLSVPYSKFKETNDKLATVRRTMAANTPAMDLQVYAIAVSPSDAARDQARQALLSPLFEDARVRADQLAKAAGMSLGSVVGVSEAWAASTSGYPYYGPSGPIGPNTLKTAFSLTVRYALK